MVEEIIFIYSICHDLLREIGFVDDTQCKMNVAEVMTVALVSAMYFHGNHSLARRFLKAHYYIHNMLSKSRFNRRVHAIDFDLWQIVFSVLKSSLQNGISNIETTFSQISRLFPKSIIAVTQRGFIIKILLFILGYIVGIAFRDRALAKSC